MKIYIAYHLINSGLKIGAKVCFYLKIKNQNFTLFTKTIFGCYFASNLLRIRMVVTVSDTRQTAYGMKNEKNSLRVTFPSELNIG